MYLFEKLKEFFGFGKKLDAARVTVRFRPRKPQAPPPVVVIRNEPINYLISDLSAPDLMKTVMPPTPPVRPRFQVQGYEGGGFEFNSLQGQAASVHVTISNVMNYYMSLTPFQIPSWAGAAILRVFPRAGQQLNAFYDRRSLQFFYAPDPSGRVIYAADSSDCVAHELGHAILDSCRPDTWRVASLEVWSFHEAFADLTAMLSILQHEEVLERVIIETGGNLRVENIASRLVEDLGKVIHDYTKGQGGRHSDCLRSAINDFKYVDAASLPEDAPDNQLAAEPHSFGRIFMGAFYDIFVMMFEDAKAQGMEPVASLRYARDKIATYALRTIIKVPISTSFFDAVAKTMLWVDMTYGDRKYHDRMFEIFSARNILKMELKILSTAASTRFPFGGIQSFPWVINTKLSDRMIRIQSENPLYNVELEIPHNECYFYDQDNNLTYTVGTSEDEALSAAETMINYLNNKGLVSNHPLAPFEIDSEGKLTRSFIS